MKPHLDIVLLFRVSLLVLRKKQETLSLWLDDRSPMAYKLFFFLFSELTTSVQRKNGLTKKCVCEQSQGIIIYPHHYHHQRRRQLIKFLIDQGHLHIF